MIQQLHHGQFLEYTFPIEYLTLEYFESHLVSLWILAELDDRCCSCTEVADYGIFPQ